MPKFTKAEKRKNKRPTAEIIPRSASVRQRLHAERDKI